MVSFDQFRYFPDSDRDAIWETGREIDGIIHQNE